MAGYGETWIRGVVQAREAVGRASFIRYIFLPAPLAPIPFSLSPMLAPRLFLLLVSLAGPLPSVHASSPPHRHLSSRMTHHRRGLCLPRMSSAPQEQVTPPAASAGYSQAEPTPVEASAPSSLGSDDTAAAPSSTDQAPTDAASSSYRTLTTLSSSAYIPNGIKAGVAGGDAYTILQNHIGWWYDWSASPHKPGNPIAVPMLWGSGKVDSTDAKRLADFQRLSSSPQHPQFVLGYEEPDCTSGGGSSGVSVEQGVREWEALMGPLKRKGTKIGSPSMCSECFFRCCPVTWFCWRK